MSFAYFDNVLTLLSEELQVPLPKLKEAWTNSFVKYFKADASILLSARKAKTLQSKSESSEPSEEKKSGKQSNKLPTCEHPNCTHGVKLVRPIEEKVYCSKHYASKLKELEKKQAAEAKVETEAEASSSEEKPKASKSKKASKKPEIEEEEKPKPKAKAPAKKSTPKEETKEEPAKKPSAKKSAKKAEPEPQPEPESEKEEVEEDLAEYLDDEEEDDEVVDTDKLLVDLREALNKFVKKPVTEDNYKQVATTNQYFAFLKANWEAVQAIHPSILEADEVKKLIDGRKIDKTELYGLLNNTLSPKLVA